MPSPPFKVKAVYEYTSPHEDDLHFPNGTIITVTEEEDDDWYSGEYVDASGVKQEGIFPRNFVEKYEPTAPPRPTRQSRPKKEAEPAPEPAPGPAQPSEPTHVEEQEPEPVQEAPVAREPPPPVPKPEVATSPRVAEPVSPPSAPKAAPSSSKPPVSDKPSGGSFRDRIAAFNKAAPPPAPFKPGGLGSGGSSNFIKKPFVAPPPSKNSYVPLPREPAPQKTYRRDEDPEIAAKESENLEQAERAGLAPATNEDAAEEQPKPTSLKERIALLQKQQMEQASRHADAAQKKEKPKRPVKKRTDSHPTEEVEGGDGASLERKDTDETVGKASMDSVREEPNVPRRRKSSSKGAVTSPGLHPRKSFGDGNDADMSGAGDTTEEPEEMSTGKDDSDDKPRSRAPQIPLRAPTAPTQEPDVGEEEGVSEEPQEQQEEEEEDDDLDPEARRKEELRARMAKMSGGMGMHGMFGGGMPMPGPPAPPKKKKSISNSEKRSGEYGADDVDSPTTRAPPVPMIPLPGLSKVRSQEESEEHEHEDQHTPISSRPSDELPDIEEVVPSQARGAPPPVPSTETYGAPPIPGGRPAPPPVPKDSRPSIPPQSMPLSPSLGSESDDELSTSVQNLSMISPRSEAPRALPRPAEIPASPRSPQVKRASTSYFAGDEAFATSPSSQGPGRRASKVPPIPGAAMASSPQNRAPPLPPHGAPPPLSRSSTGDHRVLPSPQAAPREESDEEVTEYEGDYDTDIASTAPHKDALKAHARDSSLEDNTPLRSPVTAPSALPPPLPPTAAPRAVPPPLPSQAPPLPSQPPPSSRRSSEMPRAAPPPPPPTKLPAPWEPEDDDEYDPYRYTAPKQGVSIPSVSTPRIERNDEDLYSASPPRQAHVPPPQERAAPPPPPRDLGPGPSNRGPRQSLDIQRSSTSARRSVELGRMSMDPGFVANDVDLGQSTYWWAQPKGTPPVFSGRKDILFETEESTSSKRGGKTTMTKDLYVLYQDYSQTIITAQFDAQDPADFKLEQRHEPPPSRLRQDQLEEAHEQFGRRIFEGASSKKDTVVGDGTPQGLIRELLKPFANALLPVGTRSYGALVYGNLANASTTQNDEIRPGDIITLRNTKFQGKHGPMHAKYSMEVGKPDHVGVVAEWDGTKKKVRAWEQGRESKKVKLESFKLDDLRSGEVKIWRVMPRSWVGWQGQN
ncbi:SH3 domain-containing protein C23A1.17 [Lachnellula cervina]|uniref:SH3 domain-containing protein C23A1.17 n=1 Tax=Lachnellula cervina TaxID=1316786 RepID=A0A7D8UMS4_9HELO|nr:SH3 domain-containing protein C23A1.17 [Lachnellula cervina]